MYFDGYIANVLSYDLNLMQTRLKIVPKRWTTKVPFKNSDLKFTSD